MGNKGMSHFFCFLTAFVFSNGLLGVQISVSNTTDIVNGDTSSVSALKLSDGGDGISYREAIWATNNTPGTHVIDVNVAGTVTLLSDLADITADVITINGNGLILDGNGQQYVFGGAKCRICTLNDLTFTNGGVGESFDYVGPDDGNTPGELFVMNRCTFSFNNTGTSQVFECDDPKCILNQCQFLNNQGDYVFSMCESGTTCELNECVFANNIVARDIYEHVGGDSYIRKSLFFNNTATESILLHDGTTNVDLDELVALENCTFSGNTLGAGGALFTFDPSMNSMFRIEVNNCTITETTMNGGDLMVVPSDQILSIRNSIISSSGDPNMYFDVSGNVISTNNIFEGYTGSIPYKSNSDPMLDALADNGGETMTHALLVGSPAIDMGAPFYCLPTDQRCFYRNGTCDIGAFEFDGLVSNPVPTLSQWGIIILSLLLMIVSAIALIPRTIVTRSS